MPSGDLGLASDLIAAMFYVSIRHPLRLRVAAIDAVLASCDQRTRIVISPTPDHGGPRATGVRIGQCRGRAAALVADRLFVRDSQ